MKIRKLFISSMAVVMASLLMATPVAAYSGGTNYIYDSSDQAVVEPTAYVYDSVITGESLGIGAFAAPGDIFVTDDGGVYIADTGNNRIVQLDRSFGLVRVITQFQNGEETGVFSAPQGLFVTASGEIYVADTGNNRVVRIDKDCRQIAIYGKPQSRLITDDFEYAPVKVAVDNAGRIFIVSQNVNLGILELDANGEFVCFFGAVKTVSNFKTTIAKLFTTKEQRARMALTLPTEYSSLDIDDQGFIYGTVSAIDPKNIVTEMFISRLNPMGADVLKRDAFSAPVGDVQTRYDQAEQQPLISKLNDVCARQYGVYSVMDSRMGRIFTYSGNGELMYVFGGLGSTRGLFGCPQAIDVQFDETYLVADSKYNWITVFKPTEYARALTGAVQMFYRQRFEEADRLWEQAMKYTSQSDMVLDNVGKSLSKKGQCVDAMEYFRLTEDREHYSDAFINERSSVIEKMFTGIITGVLILLVLIIFRPYLKKIWKRRERT